MVEMGMKRGLLLLLVVGVGGAIAACGESRVDQCNSIVAIANDTAGQMRVASQTSGGFDRAAQLSEQAAAQLDALVLGDKKLNTLKLHLSAAYRQTSTAGQEMAKLADSSGAVTGTAANTATIQRFRERHTALDRIGNLTDYLANHRILRLTFKRA